MVARHGREALAILSEADPRQPMPELILLDH